MFDYLKGFLNEKSHKIFLKNLLAFAGIFLGIFVVTFLALGALGFIPTEFERETRDDTVAARLSESALENLGLVPTSEGAPSYQPASNAGQGELPYRIVAASIGLDAEVVRPASANYTLLDNALAKGAVYYPGSGLAGKGNMFIFGHSTSYQYVNNKAFQIFNKVKDLKQGDLIEVSGTDKVYVYKVREVKIVNASEELVEFSNDRNMLTLSTCNSFGQKSDRYVAEADLIDSHAL